jgi:L-ascorbate metabolism protein UlaG (beta-lactamase superfamily)
MAGMLLDAAVAVEPLHGHWYVWPHLIPPASAAMYTAHAHLPLLESFATRPQAHVNALKNPAMRGGPFVEHDATRAPEMKALLDDTKRDGADLLELAAAIKELDLLLAKADGHSLEPLYEQIPVPLRGLVELTYDVRNRATMRFIEGLVYLSKYATERWQRVRITRTSSARPRHFAWSTPRLEDAFSVDLSMPLASPALDALYRARREPVDPDTLADTLGVPPELRDRFRSFFVEAPRPRDATYDGPGVRVRYFGHASVLIEAGGVSVMADPVVAIATDGPDHFTIADLPEQIDCVVLTHAHQDHVLIEPLLEIRHRVKRVLVPRSKGGSLEDPSLKLLLEKLGFANVEELDEMQEVTVGPGVTVRAIPFLGEHGDLDVRSKTAHLVHARGRSIMLMADSNNISPELYDRVHDAVGDVDTVFIGMECHGAPMSWLYGPLFPTPLPRAMDQSRRLNGSDFERAKRIVDRFNASKVFVYAMGQEPWVGHLMAIRYTPESRPIVESDKLVAHVQARGGEAARLYCKAEFVL